MSARKEPFGRPTKYLPKMCAIMRDNLALGYSLAASAGKIGVTRQTAYNFAEKHPDFFDAVNEGRQLGMALWEERLAKQAEESGGNTAAIIFAMKNMYQDDWADVVRNDHTSSDGSMTPTTVEIIAVKPNENGAD